MSKFRDFITNVEHGVQAAMDTGIGSLFDTIDSAAKKLPLGATLQASVLKLSADARHNLLSLVDGLDQDAAEVIADAGDEVLSLLANRAQLLSSPDQIAKLAAVVVAQAQAYAAQRHVGIDPANPAKSS